MFKGDEFQNSSLFLVSSSPTGLFVKIRQIIPKLIIIRFYRVCDRDLELGNEFQHKNFEIIFCPKINLCLSLESSC